MCIDEIIVLTSKEISTQISNLQSPISNDEDYILYPNPNYTPVTDTLPDGALVAYDELSGFWGTQDMRIYAKSATGTWIRKPVSVWEKFVPKPNNHSDYPKLDIHSRLHAHRVVARAWLGPIPKGWEIDHIDGNNRNYNLSNLRLLPVWMNHRDGGFITKLRHKKIDPRMFSPKFLLRYFDRMAEFKANHTRHQYDKLTHDELLRMLVSPEFIINHSNLD